METKNRIPFWKATLALTSLGSLMPNQVWILRQWRKQVAEDKVENLEKKMLVSTPEEKLKIKREILLLKARYWWRAKSFKEQFAIEKEAKRRNIKLDDYLIEEYGKMVKSQK